MYQSDRFLKFRMRFVLPVQLGEHVAKSRMRVHGIGIQRQRGLQLGQSLSRLAHSCETVGGVKMAEGGSGRDIEMSMKDQSLTGNDIIRREGREWLIGI